MSFDDIFSIWSEGARVGDLTDFVRCPSTGRSLHWTPDNRLAADTGPSYLFRDGIACLLPQTSGGVTSNDASENVRDFYENAGWTEDDTGLFGDTKVFVDTRSQSIAFTNRCIARVGRHFRKGGRYLLDAGSGPIPYDALLRYGDHFQQRVCVDLSVQGLRAARRKLGEHGVYLQGDLTNLSLKTASMDAVTCNHVIYQIPQEQQAAAFLELWRVLKPGGVAVWRAAGKCRTRRQPHR
jgi:SAM-dependent methyltransferase